MQNVNLANSTYSSVHICAERCTLEFSIESRQNCARDVITISWNLHPSRSWQFTTTKNSDSLQCMANWEQNNRRLWISRTQDAEKRWRRRRQTRIAIEVSHFHTESMFTTAATVAAKISARANIANDRRNACVPFCLYECGNTSDGSLTFSRLHTA